MRIFDSNEYINEKLNIHPVTKDMLSKMKKEPSVDEETRLFVKDNNLIWNPKTMSYDCDGDVKVSKNIITGGKLKIRFGKVSGSFDCYNNKLTSLEGAPQKVGGFFDCYRNELTTLKGAPQEVGGGFDCSRNKLTSLEGVPKKVGGNFACYKNELTTLKGAPQEVDGDFDCSFNNLTNLEGAPQKINGNFDCSGNNLTTLESAPQEVGKDFRCILNPNLVLPKDKPSWVKGKYITAL